MDIYRPTFLYIKQHKVTGLLYFGKTVQNPINYPGSGLRWARHLKLHGKEVDTIWYCLFLDQESISNFALNFSNQENIVESKEWANMKLENGLDGALVGHTMTEESKRKMVDSRKHFKYSEETKLKMSNSHKGHAVSEETKLKLSLALKGKRQNHKPFSEETKLKMSLARKGVKRKPFSEETKLKMSLAKTGVSRKPFSEETKAKMRESHKNRASRLGNKGD